MMRPHRAALTLALLWAVCSAPSVAQGPPKGAMPPAQVNVARAETKTVPVSLDYVGLTAASKTVEIRARVQGFVESRDFIDGAWIEEGARLFKIDPRPFEADREIAAAQVEQAEARLQLARQELKRMQSVTTPGAIAEADLDQRASEVANSAAALRLAKAQLDKAELNLGYTNITAPLTGYIGKALKEIGSYVDTSQNSLLAVMEQVDPLYVSFQVTESDFLNWKREMKEGLLVLAQDLSGPRVEITLLDGAAFGSHGVLDFENAGLDTKTGTVELRATFPNSDRVLKPGQFVKVHLTGWERPNVLTVPQRAVSQSPQGAYVYVVGSDGKVEMRVIQIGAWSSQDWIVLDGLREGEQVVVEGLTKVRPGATVTIAASPGTPQSAGEGAPTAAEAATQS
ncbi:MAG TPA: efflux RND transporter periplasmic adaptor subunit [Candidatus Hydrogenedentes bacterium]|nr:efflux RND transporter periplasmic adaptor subunit [Candidatus Hydrogenedentota bacterium]HPG68202.1 efflux RND transporter periplasmic adaptor subunit [Candidatus Hydrogenedentota bacterium]